MNPAKLNSQLNFVANIIFTALTFSIIFLGGLVFKGFFPSSTTTAWTPDSLFLPESYPLYLAILIACLNYFVFKKITNTENVKIKFNAIDLSVMPRFNTSEEENIYNTSSEQEKREYNIRGYLSQKCIIHWAANEFIAVMTIMSIPILGTPTNLALYIIAFAVIMQIVMRPQMNLIIGEILGKSLL